MIRALRVGLAAALLALPATAEVGAPPGPTANIVNGLPTSSFPSSGVLLLGSTPSGSGTWCSGTMIGCETFLTAAHCVCDGTGSQCQSGPMAPDPGDYLVFLQHAGFFTLQSIGVHPDFDFPVADVAVVRLAAPVDGVSPSPINTTMTPPFASDGTIVGFGRSGGSNQDTGLKRFGAVQTGSCPAGISNTTSVCWNFIAPVGPPGDDSNTCTADSGGPLFVDFGAGDVVAGVTSGGVASDCLTPDASYDANIYFYRSWIQAEGGADLSNTSCGSLPQVESDPGATVHAFDGAVSPASPEGRHSFAVPAGSLELRVTLNASEAGTNDFDLVVKHGAPPTLSDFDCAVLASGQYAACPFTSPAAGTWHVLVDRFAGSGEYQVTATVFALPECSNGADDDGDGLVDDPADPGCDDADDVSERSPLLICDNGVDDDADTLIDFPADPGCKDPESALEDPECDDGVDNDGDSGIDWDGGPGGGAVDPQCVAAPHRNREAKRSCGLGVELALLLAPLAGLRAGRRRVRRR